MHLGHHYGSGSHELVFHMNADMMEVARRLDEDRIPRYREGERD